MRLRVLAMHDINSSWFSNPCFEPRSARVLFARTSRKVINIAHGWNNMGEPITRMEEGKCISPYHKQKLDSTPSQRHVLGMVLAHCVHDSLVMHQAAGERKEIFPELPFPTPLLVLGLGRLDGGDNVLHGRLVGKPDPLALVAREVLVEVLCRFVVGGVRRCKGAASGAHKCILENFLGTL